MKKLATIILAAGKSTRMKSKKSKLLHEIGGVSIISRVVSLSKEIGSDEIVLVVNHQKDEILKEAWNIFEGAQEVLQKKTLGTGHAVSCGLERLKDFSGNILIVAGDVPLLKRETIENLVKVHNDSDAYISLLTMKPEVTYGYGRVIRGKEGVNAIIEQKDLSPEEENILECNGGIYITDAQWLRESIPKIGNDNNQNEFYLTDLVLHSENPVPGIVVKEDELMGINTMMHLAKAEKIARERKIEFHMKNGVCFKMPDTVEIDENVNIGADTVIGADVSLRGECKIGENCLIDRGSILENCEIHDDVLVKPYSVIENSVVENSAQIGPFSHLRPLTRVGKNAKVGNFVETKKTILHDKVKASHLSYLGDAEIGERTNIGAGTITCNYDGVNKFKTTIGKDVFIGSDSQIIAPVVIEDGAYVGTGTTVLNDIQPGSLAINPKKQKNISPWIPPAKRK